MIKRLASVMLFVFSLGGGFCSHAASTNSITFKNSGTRRGPRILYVELVSGSCKAPSPLRATMPVDPNTTRNLSIPGNTDSACWIVSTYQTVSMFPMHCGDAKAGDKIEISETTAVCNMDMDDSYNVKHPTGVSTQIVTGTYHVEYSLTSWNDPLTPPHTITSCIGSASGHWPWCDNWSTCNQWETQCQFMRNEAFLVIDAGASTDLKGIVDKCLQQSVCAAALAAVTAAIVTGGAALAAAEQAFTDVMVACLAGQVTGLSVNFDIRSHWTPYGSCK